MQTAVAPVEEGIAVYQGRAARLNLSFPVEFRTEGGTLRGDCLNISESGLLGTFWDTPELWLKGDLRLYVGAKAYDLPARVARVLDREAGFTFLFRNDEDRQAIRAILVFAENNTHLVGRPPF